MIAEGGVGEEEGTLTSWSIKTLYHRECVIASPAEERRSWNSHVKSTHFCTLATPLNVAVIWGLKKQ